MADDKKDNKPQEEPKEEKKKEKQKEEAPSKEEKTKKRTKKQFKKLKKSNKELKEKVTEYRSVIDSLKPRAPQPPKRDEQPTTGKGMGPGLTMYSQPKRQELTQNVPQAEQYSNLSQDQIDDMFSGMMDDKGYVDGNKLLNSLKQMNKRAQQAEERARRAEAKIDQVGRQQRDFEESQEERRVHRKYPKIDPKSDDFDPEFFDAVRNEMIGQMMEGKRDFMAAAKKWNKKLYGKEDMATKKEKQEAEAKEDAKAQINATQPKPTSSYQKNYQDLEHEKLVEETMKGKKGALAERLRRSGHGPS